AVGERSDHLAVAGFPFEHGLVDRQSVALAADPLERTPEPPRRVEASGGVVRSGEGLEPPFEESDEVMESAVAFENLREQLRRPEPGRSLVVGGGQGGNRVLAPCRVLEKKSRQAHPKPRALGAG